MNKLFRCLKALPIVAGFTLVATPSVYADVYMYTDEMGVTHITNIQPSDQRFKRFSEGCDTMPGGCGREENPRLFTNTYNQYIETAALSYRVHPDLIRAVIHAESAFNHKALSRKGAQGLMQLMPATAEELGVSDAFDPQQNINGGVKYLSQLLDMFNDNLELAVAAYNAGQGTVMRYQGIPPYEETKEYVKRVRKLFKLYREERNS